MKKWFLIFLVFAGVLVMTNTTILAAPAQQLPIEDFVDRQGKYCITSFDPYMADYSDPCIDGILFVPPIANFIGWFDPETGYAASIDYAGLADEYSGGIFGTSMTGSVTERPLKDGRAEVHVVLHTKDALTWVATDFDFNGPLLFGQRAPEVLAGAESSLGESTLQVKFINTAPGAQLPDLLQLFIAPEPGQEVLSLSFHSRADGTLADGTPGRAQVTQTGVFMTGGNGATEDGYPAEHVIVLSVGQ